MKLDGDKLLDWIYEQLGSFNVEPNRMPGYVRIAREVLSGKFNVQEETE